MRSDDGIDDFRSLTLEELWELRQDAERRIEQDLLAKTATLVGRLRHSSGNAFLEFVVVV
jgi:hypothetical protein